MAEETDPVSQTTESLKRVQTFDSSTLVQRDKHGQYAFDGAVAPADRLISLFNQMRLDALTTFPQRELQIVRNNAEKIFGKFQDILDFDQNNTEVVPISDKVKRLVTALDNEYEGVFSELMPLISYATCRTVDLGSIENEARATAESIRGEVDKLVKEVEKQNEEASGILERIRKAAAETGVSQEEIHFANLANKYKNRAFWWLLAHSRLRHRNSRILGISDFLVQCVVADARRQLAGVSAVCRKIRSLRNLGLRAWNLRSKLPRKPSQRGCQPTQAKCAGDFPDPSRCSQHAREPGRCTHPCSGVSVHPTGQWVHEGGIAEYAAASGNRAASRSFKTDGRRSVRRRSIIVALLMAWPTGAASEDIFSDVSVLVPACRSALAALEGRDAGATITKMSGCISYIAGVSDHMHRLCLMSVHPLFNRNPAIPLALRFFGYDGTGYSTEAKVRIVVRYAEQHPGEWNEGSLAIVSAALQEASPCPELEPSD